MWVGVAVVEVEANGFSIGLVNVGDDGIFIVDVKCVIWVESMLVFNYDEGGDVVGANAGGQFMSPNPSEIVFEASLIMFNISNLGESLAPFCASCMKYLLMCVDTNSSMILKILGSCDALAISSGMSLWFT